MSIGRLLAAPNAAHADPAKSAEILAIITNQPDQLVAMKKLKTALDWSSGRLALCDFLVTAFGGATAR